MFENADETFIESVKWSIIMMSVAHNRGGGTNVTAQPFPSSFSEHGDDDSELLFDG